MFDGALPEAKRDERLSRLGKNNQHVRQLRSNYPAAACPIPSQLGSVLHSLLAPELREALSRGRYASVTRMVPGEADDYCASYVNDKSHCLIFTNDTDLVLFNYPADFRLFFMRDVELWPEPKFKGYSPIGVQQALHLTSLVPLAYCIMQDPSKSFSESLEDARAIDAKSKEYQLFRKRYISPCGNTSRDDEAHSSALQSLDVRISEFVHQAFSEILIPVLYLPLFVEDPNQASAWNMGEAVRSLAYSLLTPNRTIVHEYKRKAQAIALQEVRVQSPTEANVSAAALSSNVAAWRQITLDQPIPPELVWLLVALNLVLPELNTHPRTAYLVRVLNGEFDNTWEFIHLTARIQAALYSLRILNQCAVVWLSLNQVTTGALTTSIRELHATLKDMSAISELFLIPGQSKGLRGDAEVLQQLINEIYTLNDIEVPLEHVSNKKLKKQKREAERKAKREQAENERRTRDLFKLLN